MFSGTAYLYLARLFSLFFFSRRIRFFFHLALIQVHLPKVLIDTSMAAVNHYQQIPIWAFEKLMFLTI